MVRGQINGNLWKSIEIYGNPQISMEIHDSWARRFGALWRAVARCGNLAANGGPLDTPKETFVGWGASDYQIIGWWDHRIIG